MLWACTLFNSSREFSDECCIHRFEEVNTLGTVWHIFLLTIGKRAQLYKFISSQRHANTCRMEKDILRHFPVLAKTSRSICMNIRHFCLISSLVETF